MDTNKHHDGQTLQRDYLEKDLAVGAIIKFTIGLLVVTAIIYLATIGLMRVLEKVAIAENPNKHPLAAQRQAEPLEPRLQPDPVTDLKEYQHAEKAALEGKTPGSIPVEQGMEKVLQQGFPTRSDEESKKWLDKAEQMPSASGAGRVMEKRLR